MPRLVNKDFDVCKCGHDRSWHVKQKGSCLYGGKLDSCMCADFKIIESKPAEALAALKGINYE